jgi:outer membrane protein W
MRYYFNVQSIKPFVGVGYSFANENSSLSDEDIKHNNIILNVGADYFLTDNIALETILGYTFMNIKYPKEYNLYYSDLETSRKSLSIGIGINVFLR